MKIILKALCLLFVCISTYASDFNAAFQTTYINQQKPAFASTYSGQNSLPAFATKDYSFTTAAFITYTRNNTLIEYVPEVSQGVAFNNLTGLGGETDGELQKVAGPHPIFYRARLFIQQSYSINDTRITTIAGNFALPDYLDSNSVSHDARTQFQNWSFIDYGAWDFAADARGYTRGVVIVLDHKNDSIRLARALMPILNNGLGLNSHIFQSFGDNLELEHRYSSGVIRFLAFHNKANMALYQDALASASLDGVRHNQYKSGHGFSWEQHLSDNLSMFVRYSTNDGEGEEFCFTDIDRSYSQGFAYKLGKDTIGIAVANNNISGDQIAFMREGGYDIELGDGKLTHYQSEQILETYYNWQANKHLWITPDFQYIKNPGYNADRGPALFYGIRFHAEY